jgi:hypothetical protein
MIRDYFQYGPTFRTLALNTNDGHMNRNFDHSSTSWTNDLVHSASILNANAAQHDNTLEPKESDFGSCAEAADYPLQSRGVNRPKMYIDADLRRAECRYLERVI